MRLRIVCCFLFLACCLCLPGLAAPTCAIVADSALGFDQSPLFALFETHVVQSGAVTSLERTEIAKVLDEHKLALLFSAEGGRDRVAVGKILKADLLVLLKADEVVDTNMQHYRSVRLILSETRSGLRLMMGTVPWTDDAEGESAALQSILRQGLAKYARKTEICVVPAFANQNLSHELDYLGEGYAALITKRLLQEPGLVVVELSEAQSITNELALTGGEGVTRKSPLFLTGEFRHTGQGAAQRATIRLALKRGATELKSVSKEGLSSMETGPWLLQATQELLAGANFQVPALDAAAQAAQLATEANRLRQAGQWNESLNLLQAGLLLAPDQPQLFYDAAVMAGRVASQVKVAPLQKDMTQFLHDGRQVLDGYRRVRDYLDAYQRATGYAQPDPYFSDPKRNFIAIINAINSYCNVMSRERKPAHLALLAEYQQVDRELCDRVFPEFERYAATADIASELVPQLIFAVDALCESGALTRGEEFALRLRIFQVTHRDPWLEYKAAKWMLEGNFHIRYSKEELTSPEFLDFCAQTEAVGGPVMAATARELRALEPNKPCQPDLPVPGAGATAATPVTKIKVTLTPLSIKLREADGTLSERFNLRGSYVPCGSGVDALLGLSDVYLMKEPGVLTSVYQSPSGYHLDELHFDGRLLWVLLEPPRPHDMDLAKLPPALVVAIDPVSGKVTTFSSTDGIPPALFLCGAPWSPGKFFLAGNSGKSWCALVTLGTDGKKSVDLFFEARTYSDPASLDVNTPIAPGMVFIPRYAVKMTSQNRSVILLGRYFSNTQGLLDLLPCRYPLIIDLAKRTVTTAAKPVPAMNLSSSQVHGDSLIYSDEQNGRIFTATYPALESRELASAPPLGWCTLQPDGQRTHCYRAEDRIWWMVEGPAGPCGQVDLSALPDAVRFHFLASSVRYGLLLIGYDGQSSRCYQVTFPKPATRQ